MSTRTPTTRRRIGLIAAAAIAVSACGSDDPETQSPDTDASAEDAEGADPPAALTLVTYSSYPPDDADEPNPLQIALDEFTDDTGIEVDVLVSGDTGTMLAKAELTAGNPEGDVMWGIDNTFISRALDGEIFEPYESPVAVDVVPAELRALAPEGAATPVDFGDVCVNYDTAALDAADLPVPTSFDDLADERYRDLLAVQNPATSSPGLAFLLATIAEYGSDGWEDYWERLVDNGVRVVDSWDIAYYEDFSRAGGDRPLVVSYGSSPPFEVLYASEPVDEAPTGVVEATCFRQVEFAGILRGTEAPDEARQLIDFLVSERYQREVPLNLFVFPANAEVVLDDVFIEHATIPDAPLSLDPETIAAEREGWVDRWTSIVTG